MEAPQGEASDVSIEEIAAAVQAELNLGPDPTVASSTSLKGHKDSVLSLDTNGEGVLLASSSEDSTVRVWDLRTARVTKCIAQVFGSNPVNSVCFGKGSTDQLLFASAGPKAYSFDLRRPELILKEFTKEFAQAKSSGDNELNQIAISADGRHLAICDDESEVKLINIETNKLDKTLRRHSNIVYSICFRPNKPAELFSGGCDSTFIHWDFVRGRPLNMFNFQTQGLLGSQPQVINPPFVFSIDIAPSGALVACGLGNYNVAVMEPNTFTPLCMLSEHTAAVTQVRFPAFSPERHLISGGNGSPVILWDIKESFEWVQRQQARKEAKKAKAAQAKSKNARAARKARQKQQPEEEEEEGDIEGGRVVLKIAHEAKLNAMTTANANNNTCGNVFLADQTADITALTVAFG